MGWRTMRRVWRREDSRSTVLGAVAAVSGIAALTALLVPFRTDLGPLNVGLLYLLLVTALAARWGWGVGLFASVAANLTFNFFFVPPRFRFHVAEPANALELLVFLCVAAITSALLGRARAGEAAARRHEREAALLYDLSRLTIVAGGTRETLTAICGRIKDTLAVRSCSVLTPVDGRLTVVASSDDSTRRTQTAYERGAAEEAFAGGTTVFLGGRGRRQPRVVGVPDRRVPVVYLPLRVGDQAVGVLEVVAERLDDVNGDEEMRLVEAFADIAALAVDRDRLLREAARAEAFREADQLKSALLSAVSHDLRTPLTTIVASASSLLHAEVEWSETDRRQFLVQIEEQGLRLTRLVENLLDLSRIEGGAIRPGRDRHDVGEALEDAIAAAAPVAAGHRITLTIAGDVPPALFDRVHIGQVLQNLIENAAKFSPQEGEIRVAARRAGSDVEILVEDEGAGIPPGERERVFEKFYSAAGRDRRARGAGLGLAICKGLVEANGGRIRIESGTGGGARVIVALPAATTGAPPAEVHSVARNGR